MELNGRSDQFGGSTLRVIYRYSIATAFAFLVGLVNVRFGAVYALGEYIAPIGLLGFGAMYSNRPEVLGRWCNSIVLSGLAVAIYGIWQFYTIPPWDAFWVEAVNFEGYLGILEPTKMTLFSTMSDRGPAATYLCSCLILIALRPRTLGWLRLPAGLLILYAMLLTYSRTTMIQFGLAVILYPLLNRGVGMKGVVAIVILALIFGETLLQRLPGSATASERVSSIGNIANDGSFRGRIALLGYAFSNSLSEPLGLGIGSHGLASRVSTGMKFGQADSTGYVEALRTYGWIGFALLVSVFLSLWMATRVIMEAEIPDANVFLFRAWYISGLAATFSGGWFFTATFFWVLGGFCLAQSDEIERDNSEQYDLDEGVQLPIGQFQNFTEHPPA
ncbi:MAG TPA: hypothetical protein DDZ51_08620 [Planctomycetaceae bacterium]|nr:hypothetical protein [Planctomycetaceae bacterium]